MKKIIIMGVALALLFGGFAAEAATAVSELSIAASVEASASNEWDALLDEYEACVNQYIRAHQKAKSSSSKSGAVAEYITLASKVKGLSAKIDKNKGKMSVSQIARYVKITKKFTDEAKSK